MSQPIEVEARKILREKLDHMRRLAGDLDCFCVFDREPNDLHDAIAALGEIESDLQIALKVVDVMIVRLGRVADEKEAGK